MFSLKCITAVGLMSWLVIGCGSDATAPSGQGGSGSASEPSNCDTVGAQQKSRITALGCDDTSATVAAGCKALYAGNICVTEWEALINCITPKPNSDFECDDDNELAPKTGVCTSQRAAFDGCAGN